MPYVKKAETPFAPVARLLRGYASARKIAIATGHSPDTIRRRMINPADFTLGELREISRVMHIPKDEIVGAIKW